MLWKKTSLILFDKLHYQCRNVIMISIVICSINQFLLTQLTLNIEETIGVAHQIIVIKNSGTGNGISKSYNNGGAKATFPIICFIHEDIIFITNNWGQLIIKHFNEDPKVGLLGLAGGDTKGIVPSGWFTSFKAKEVNIVQHFRTGAKKARHEYFSEEEGTPKRRKVVAVDGVFLCTRREIFNLQKFDDNLLKGFHGYDIDYSLQVLANYDVAVIFDVLIHHYSEGKLNRDWLEGTRAVTRKWKKKLPVSVYNLSPSDYNLFHWKSLQVFIEHLFRLNYSYTQIIGQYFKYSFCGYFNVRRFLSMGKYVMLSMYKKPNDIT